MIGEVNQDNSKEQEIDEMLDLLLIEVSEAFEDKIIHDAESFFKIEGGE